LRLDQLPEHVAKGIAGIRVISTKHLGKSLKGKCRWCRGPVVAPRRNWCGEKCINLFLQLRDLPSTIIDIDKGRCQICNCDVLYLAYLIRTWYYKSELEQKDIQESYPDWFQDSHPRYSKTWAVDHIIPCWKSGTSTSENLQILCFIDHQTKTNREASERAKYRRKKK